VHEELLAGTSKQRIGAGAKENQLEVSTKGKKALPAFMKTYKR